MVEEPRRCENCGEPLIRKVRIRTTHGHINRITEYLPRFQARKYCDAECRNSHLLRSLWTEESFRAKAMMPHFTPEQLLQKSEQYRQQWADGTRRVLVAKTKRRTVPNWNGLSDDAVRNLIADRRKHKEIAADYQISVSLVGKIKGGRSYRIDNAPLAALKVKKLSDADVQAILAASESNEDIAKKYGISKSHVGNIKHGRRRTQES